ncbi:MAG TPA: membrane protein insertase YidC [Allosphingosinicella sp.]|nr:membrane protein insertase YidC [Allosphingosinicella sp.]
MNEHRNLVLAVLLSAIVLLGWTFVSSKFITPATPPSTKVVRGKQVPVAKPGETPAPTSPAALRSRAIVLRETPRIAIETPRLQGSVNLKGARIDDLVLTRHRETIAKDSPPVRLLSPSGAPDAYFAAFGWTGEGLTLPGPDTVWTASGPRLAPGSPVTLSWDNAAGQTFRIRLSVDDGYLFSTEQRVENRGGAPVAVRPYALVSRVGKSKDPTGWTMHTGPVGVFNGKADYGTDFKDLDKSGEEKFATAGGWIGFGDKYWQTALVPDQSRPVEASFRHSNGVYQADFIPSPALVAPGKAADYQSRFFAGAKEVDMLNRYKKAGVEQLDMAIDWGWFWFFEEPIFYLLDWLFKAIGNFGVAIMCLTLIIRTLMFPIAQKQFKSMAGMRVIQPKMKALQERFKDDKPRMQQEIMKLYQEEKVNPVAGCLPVLLQIPIFYALYKVLMLTIEMRHQPFILWLKDLSAPDPMTPVNLFGFLPFTPPAVLAIGVLPLLVGFTMYLLQKLNPPAPDPMQQQIMMFMPWMLMFIFAPLAAGLQLYYVVNNTLSIAQQRWLYSRYPGMRAAQPAK